MGWAARAKKEAKIKALQDGTLTEPPSVLDRMRPQPVHEYIRSGQLAAILAKAHGLVSMHGGQLRNEARLLVKRGKR